MYRAFLAPNFPLRHAAVVNNFLSLSQPRKTNVHVTGTLSLMVSLVIVNVSDSKSKFVMILNRL